MSEESAIARMSANAIWIIDDEMPDALARDRGLTLATLGRGAITPAPGAVDTLPIDLRDPRFANPRSACTWLMLPRRD